MAKKKATEQKAKKAAQPPAPEMAIIALSFDRATGRLSNALSGWESISEAEGVVDLFVRQVLRPAAIQEEANRIAAQGKPE